METSAGDESGADSRDGRTMEFCVVGCWLAIPAGVFIARQRLLPIFVDFDVSLPTATQYLLSFPSPILLAAIAFIVLLSMALIPRGPSRRGLIRIALISGVIVSILCSMVILGPWLSLVRSLS